MASNGKSLVSYRTCYSLSELAFIFALLRTEPFKIRAIYIQLMFWDFSAISVRGDVLEIVENKYCYF